MTSNSGEDEKVVRERRGGRQMMSNSSRLPEREVKGLPRHKAKEVRRSREAWMGRPISRISWGVVPFPLDTNSICLC